MADCLSWLVTTALANAASAALLGVIACAVGRWSRRPAVAHGLWAIVLLKLLTPPLVEVPVGWKLDLFAPRQQPLSSLGNDREAGEPVRVVTASRAFPAAHALAPQPDAFANNSQVSSPTTARNVPETSSAKAADGFASPGLARFGAFMASLNWQRAATLTATCLLVVWLGGIAACLALLARRAWAFWCFISRAAINDRSLPRRVKQLASEAGLKAAPQTIVVQGVVSPMLWGVGSRVALIFPDQLVRQLSPAACDALVLHELAHYSRGDQWLRILELIAQVIYWWHPVVWWARHEIEAAEEQCCDAWVVSRQSGSRRTYAEALLATIDFLCEPAPHLPPTASGLGEVPLLRIRLTQIMHGELATGLSTGAKLALLGMAITALPIGPALLEASVTPRHISLAVPTADPQPLEIPPLAASEPSPESSPTTPDIGAIQPDKASATLRSLPAATPSRVAVTATAISPSGKYQLQRRKGSQVTLVNQATNWRLDMSAHGILCVAFTPDSRLFVTGHEDGLVRAWDSETGGLAYTLKGSTGPVWSVAVTTGDAENCRVAAGSKDGGIVLWQLASGEELARLAPADSSVSCLRWSPQGDRLAVSFGDFSNREELGLVIWSPTSNHMLAQVLLDQPAAALAWLPDGEHLLVADWHGAARLWYADLKALGAPVSLGASGKLLAEAANWSADCPLAPALAADDLAIRVD